MALFTEFELKEFDSASLTGAYQNFGTALTNPCYEVIISNESNVAVYISKDGSDDIRVGAGVTITVTALRRFNTLTEAVYLYKTGTQLQIKQVTGAGTGTVVANVFTTTKE